MVRFAHIAQEWFNDKRMMIKQSSLSVYHNVVYKNLIPYFNTHQNISNLDVQAYIVFCTDNGLSGSSVKDRLKVLDAILKFGSDREMCGHFKFDIEYPTILKSRKREEKHLSVVEVRKLRHYLMGNCAGNLYHLAICLALSSGIRIGEATGLKFSDFDFKNKMFSINRTSSRVAVFNEENKIISTRINVGTPKTKSSNRKVPISDDLLAIIEKLGSDKDKDAFVFRSKYKELPMDTRLLRQHFCNVLRSLKLPKVKFHSLRHSFASNCIASSIDVKTTSALLGHSDVKMTLDIYTHSSLEQKRAAINKLGRLFG